MKNLIQRAKNDLPQIYKECPWTLPELKHGTAILQTEDELNAYTAAYGEMHEIKCKAALQNFPFEDIKGSVQIVDWGCGQGFGSYCTIRQFEEHKKESLIRSVVLIEPSKAALQKAIININELTKGSANIFPMNCYCPGDGTRDEVAAINYTCDYVIHIFSNILDIPEVNLEKLAQLCVTSQCKAFILCISPKNSNSYRVERFHSIFGLTKCFSSIDDYAYSRTSDTGHIVSCKTRCFCYDGGILWPEDKNIVVSADFVGNKLVTDDYDLVESGFFCRQSPLLQKLYTRLCREINPYEDITMLNANIDGDSIDLIVLRPGRGVLIVKVFDDYIKDYVYAVKLNTKGEQQIDKNTIINQKTREKMLSPIVSIGGYQKKLLNGVDEDLLKISIGNSQYLKIVQKMVLFTKNTTSEIHEFFQGNFDYTLLFGNDFEDQTFFKGKTILNMIWKDSFPSFTKSMVSSFIRIICPNWHSRKEGCPVVLSPEQERLSKSVGGRSQKISGVAGSGKTLVLAARCVNAQKRTGGDVLVLTFNKTLATHMQHRINEVYEDFPWNKIHISHYHKFFRQHAHSALKHVSMGSYDDHTFFDAVRCKSAFRRYDAIFVDEVQDYKTEWLQILKNDFLLPDGEFVVFGDPKQNVYNRELDENGDMRLGIIHGQWNHELCKSRRYNKNTQLITLFNRFKKFFFKETDEEEPKENAFGSLFSRIEYSNLNECAGIDSLYEHITSIIQKSMLRHDDITILAHGNALMRELADKFFAAGIAPLITTFSTNNDVEVLKNKYYKFVAQHLYDQENIDSFKKYSFTTRKHGIKMSTIDSFKGWESPVVILILQDESHAPDNFRLPVGTLIPELVYTGITRATESLFIVNLGNMKYDKFFNENINL